MSTPTLEAVEAEEPILEAPPAVRERSRFGRRHLIGIGLIAALVILPGQFGDFGYFVGQYAAIYAILGLSVTVVTGYSGSISLMPYSFAGIGAVITGMAMNLWGWPFWLAIPLAGLATLPVSLVIGIASVRLKTLYLAIATLTFSNALGETFFRWNRVTGGRTGWVVRRPRVGPVDFSGDFSFFLLCLATVLLLVWMVEGLRTSRLGRAMLAVRDNELEAQALGINVYKTKLVAFMLSGMVAGTGGAFLAPFLGNVSPSAFQSPTAELTSILLVTLVVIGGVDRAMGAFFGAASLIVTQEVFRGATFFFKFFGAYSALGLMIFLLRVPGGLVQLFKRQVELIKLRPTFGVVTLAIGVGINVGIAYLFIRLS